MQPAARIAVQRSFPTHIQDAGQGIFHWRKYFFRTARFRQGLEGTGAMAPQGSTASKPIWALVFLFPSAARWTAVCHHAPLDLWQCPEQTSILTERHGARSPVNSWSEPRMVWRRALQPKGCALTETAFLRARSVLQDRWETEGSLWKAVRGATAPKTDAHAEKLWGAALENMI